MKRCYSPQVIEEFVFNGVLNSGKKSGCVIFNYSRLSYIRIIQCVMTLNWLHYRLHQNVGVNCRPVLYIYTYIIV